MARGRKRRRRRQRSSQPTSSPDTMLQLARTCLHQQDARNALTHLKAARQLGVSSAQLDCLLYAASMARARQLAKTAPKDAAELRRQADRHATAVDAAQPDDEDLAIACQHMELSRAIRIYGQRAAGNAGALPRVAGVLADRVVVSQEWQAVTTLEPELPLRCDAPHVRLVLPAMNVGDWTRADDALAVLPRSSPFARWRIFCKAMAGFAAGDNDGVRRALDLLPHDFCMVHTVEELRGVFDSTRVCEPAKRQARVADLMWRGGDPTRRRRLGRELVRSVRKRRPVGLDKIVDDLARAVCPQHLQAARTTLLELLGLGVLQDGLSSQSLSRACRELLSPDHAALVCAKVGVWAQTPDHDEWDLEPAREYLAHLGTELSEPRQQDLARARLLEHLARTGSSAGVCLDCAGPEVARQASQLAGQPLSDPGLIFAELMRASLEADPDNRKGYHFFLELVRGTTYPPARLEQVLLTMRSRFPHDPEPCLELAAAYYSKNAFRKAEAEIEEANRRVPHDEKILDLRAIGYLRTGDEKRKRKKYGQAAEQLAKAEELKRPSLETVIELKRAALGLLKHHDRALPELRQRLDLLPPVEQLRFLALLLCDLGPGRTRWLQRPIGERLQEMVDEYAGLVEELTPDEVAHLAAPLDERLDLLFPDRRVAPYLARLWPRLLRRAAAGSLRALVDVLFDSSDPATLRQVIEEAMAEQDPWPVLLRFVHAVLEAMDDRASGAGRILEAVQAASPEQQSELRAMAQRLAEGMHGPLAQSLRDFDFEAFDLAASLAREEPSLELLRKILLGKAGIPLFDDWDEDEEDPIAQELDDLESILDEQGMRGAPDSLVRRFAAAMRADPRARRDLAAVARQIEEGDYTVSRELSILLWPEKKRKPNKRQLSLL